MIRWPLRGTSSEGRRGTCRRGPLALLRAQNAIVSGACAVAETRGGIEGWFFPEHDRWLPRIAGGAKEKKCVKSGESNKGSTWSDGLKVEAGDTVVIPSGFTVTWNSTAITIAGCKAEVGSTFAGSGGMETSGNVSLLGTVTWSSTLTVVGTGVATITIGTAELAGNVVINVGGKATAGSAIKTKGRITVNGELFAEGHELAGKSVEAMTATTVLDIKGATVKTTGTELGEGWVLGNVSASIVTNASTVIEAARFNGGGISYGEAELVWTGGEVTGNNTARRIVLAENKTIKLKIGSVQTATEALVINGKAGAATVLESSKAGEAAKLKIPEGEATGTCTVKDIAFEGGPTYLPNGTNVSGNSVVKPAEGFTVAFEAKPSGTITKTFTASVSSSGGLGRNVARSMAAALTSAGAFPRNVFTRFSAALTGAGALGRTTSHGFTAVLTSTGTFARGKITTFLAAALSATGTLRRNTSRGMVAALSPAGLLSRNTFTSFAAKLAPTGILSRGTTRLLAATLSPAASFTAAEVGRIVRIFTAALTSSGQLQRSTSRKMTASSTPAGAIVRTIARTMPSTVASTGALNRSSSKRFAAATVPAGTVRRSVTKTLSATLAPAATLGRNIGRVFTGALGLAGKLSHGQNTRPQGLPTRATFAARKTTATSAIRGTRGRFVRGLTRGVFPSR